MKALLLPINESKELEILLSVLPRIFRVVVGFTIAFSAVYQVYT